MNITEYLKTKYKQRLFLDLVKSNTSSQPNTNSTTEIPAKVVEDNGSHYFIWTTTGKRTM